MITVNQRKLRVVFLFGMALMIATSCGKSALYSPAETRFVFKRRLTSSDNWVFGTAVWNTEVGEYTYRSPGNESDVYTGKHGGAFDPRWWEGPGTSAPSRPEDADSSHRGWLDPETERFPDYVSASVRAEDSDSDTGEWHFYRFEGHWEVVNNPKIRCLIRWNEAMLYYQAELESLSERMRNAGFSVGEVVATVEPVDEQGVMKARVKWRTGQDGVSTDVRWEDAGFVNVATMTADEFVRSDPRLGAVRFRRVQIPGVDVGPGWPVAEDRTASDQDL